MPDIEQGIMQQRTLGRDGLTTSAIGYGSMGTVMAYGAADDTESVDAIRHAHEMGVTHFDTAEVYGWGRGEELLGRALTPIRDDVSVATKFGLGQDGGPLNSRPEHIAKVVDQSLQRLNTDIIDLLYQHKPDPKVPTEDVVGAMSSLVAAGKVRYIGLSNADDTVIRAGHAVHPIAAYQTEFSLFTRPEPAVWSTLKDLGIGLVAYSPLARGFLTGAVPTPDDLGANDARRSIGWWENDRFASNQKLVRQLTEIAKNRDVTLSQLSLAWLLAQSENVVPIPGSRNARRVEENAGAATISLTPEELQRIDAIVPGTVPGGFAW